MFSLVRANLTKVTSPPNSTPRRFRSYLLLTLLLYFLFFFQLPWCMLQDFPFVSSVTSLTFLPCSHRKTRFRNSWPSKVHNILEVSIYYLPNRVKMMTDIMFKASVCISKDFRTRRNLSSGYLELEPKFVKNWPNKG